MVPGVLGGHADVVLGVLGPLGGHLVAAGQLAGQKGLVVDVAQLLGHLF